MQAAAGEPFGLSLLLQSSTGLLEELSVAVAEAAGFLLAGGLQVFWRLPPKKHTGAAPPYCMRMRCCELRSLASWPPNT